MVALRTVTAEAQAVLGELEAIDVKETKDGVPIDGTPIDKRVRCISRAIGMTFHFMAMHARATRILELGTSAGYSTVWLGSAVRHGGGKVTTIEQDTAKVDWARRNLDRADLADYVSVVQADAESFIQNAIGPWDFVFMDHESRNYISSFDLLREKIAPRGIVVADGWSRLCAWDTDAHLVAYRQHVEQDSEYQVHLLPVEKGELVAIRIP